MYDMYETVHTAYNFPKYPLFVETYFIGRRKRCSMLEKHYNMLADHESHS